MSFWLSLTSLFPLISCSGEISQTPTSDEGSALIEHTQWNDLVKKYVAVDGVVDYRGFQRDSLKLNAYLDLLTNHPPAIDWPHNDKLAYWINTYNAFTVKVIVDHYPLKSIRELHTLPGIATVWHRKFFNIGDGPMSLNYIEHKILRLEFNEPRIHFAINCASKSCPVLRNEAYSSEKLESQLTDQARAFLQHPFRNKISAEAVQLSRIFKWFKKDFVKQSTLIEFLNQYAPVEIQADAQISYIDYDWTLNE